MKCRFYYLNEKWPFSDELNFSSLTCFVRQTVETPLFVHLYKRY